MNDFKTTTHLQESYDSVDWIDTDASEDEDYLPQFPHEQQFPVLPSIKEYFLNQQLAQEEEEEEDHEEDNSSSSENSQEYMEFDRKRERINSSSWDTINTRDLFRRKLGHKNETPYDKLRQAIDKTVDNGLEKVDLSNIGLTDIPDEISELQYVTVLHNDIVKSAFLQLYLYNNELTTLNLTLFKLKNLTVLSLRHNHLSSIPPEVALLENLIELSIGNNHLTCIPAELLRLKKLCILSLLPNPFTPQTDSNNAIQRIKPLTPTVTSLKEISTRAILATTNHRQQLTSLSKIIPDQLLNQVRSISSVNYCEHCKILFHEPDIEELVWKDVFGNPHIPVLYRYCSLSCNKSFSHH